MLYRIKNIKIRNKAKTKYRITQNENVFTRNSFKIEKKNLKQWNTLYNKEKSMLSPVILKKTVNVKVALIVWISNIILQE